MAPSKFAVRHGKCNIYCSTVDDLEKAVRRFSSDKALEGPKRPEPALNFEDCIPRVSKLQLLETHFGMRFSGLGQTTARVKKSAGNRAANLVRDLNSDFGCYRH